MDSAAAEAEPDPHPSPDPVVPLSAALAQWKAVWRDSSHPSLPATQLRNSWVVSYKYIFHAGFNESLSKKYGFA